MKRYANYKRICKLRKKIMKIKNNAYKSSKIKSNRKKVLIKKPATEAKPFNAQTKEAIVMAWNPEVKRRMYWWHEKVRHA